MSFSLYIRAQASFATFGRRLHFSRAGQQLQHAVPEPERNRCAAEYMVDAPVSPWAAGSRLPAARLLAPPLVANEPPRLDASTLDPSLAPAAQ
jgi:hypothetical protein